MHCEITAWNSDHSQSVEQLAYIDEDYSDDGAVHPPKNPVYLFGGNPANVKNSVSLRTKPSTKAAVITETPVGSQIGIYSCDTDGWYWAEYGRLQGYVNAKLQQQLLPQPQRLKLRTRESESWSFHLLSHLLVIRLPFRSDWQRIRALSH